jgi:large conductance mechanosensitive channel
MAASFVKGRKERTMILNEFKSFIARGNVVDMAVGIIMGASFTTIVKSLVDDVIMPFLGIFTGGIDFSGLYLNLSTTQYPSLAVAKAAGAATINYGIFINAVIAFLIVSFVVFLLVKGVNKLTQTIKKAEAEASNETPAADIQLLTEIRDLLKK